MVLNAHVTEGKAGSIGPSWPPAPSTSNRLKGIHPKILLNSGQVNGFIDDMHMAQKQHSGFTRVSVRTFIDRSERRKLGPRWDGLKVEGILPSDHLFGAPVDLVYLGRNEPCRLPQKPVFDEMLATNMDQANNKRPAPESVFSSLDSKGYSLERLSFSAQSLRKDLEDLALLYEEALPVYMFKITPNTLLDLLNDQSNVFLVARYCNQIVSALIAEYASIEIEGKPIHLFELSDFATSERVFGNHQGHRLMTALQLRAIENIRSVYGDEVLIYAEDRAQLPAVVRSSYYAGLVPSGALPIHVKIGGKRDPRFNEGVPGMETLVPVAWLPSGVSPPSRAEVLELHDVKL